jgi:signal peptidase II
MALVGDSLELRYTENRDVAFNALRVIPESYRKPLILATGGVAIAALSIALAPLKGSTARALAFATIFAGAVGNYWDRLARGYVIDFVHLAHWPVFNLADVYIAFGAALLLLLRERGSLVRT